MFLVKTVYYFFGLFFFFLFLLIQSFCIRQSRSCVRVRNVNQRQRTRALRLLVVEFVYHWVFVRTYEHCTHACRSYARSAADRCCASHLWSFPRRWATAGTTMCSNNSSQEYLVKPTVNGMMDERSYILQQQHQQKQHQQQQQVGVYTLFHLIEIARRPRPRRVLLLRRFVHSRPAPVLLPSVDYKLRSSV